MQTSHSEEREPARELSHLRLSVAALLTLLLAILWLSGQGPRAGSACCPIVDTTVAAGPAYTITAPNAEVAQTPSTLKPWSGPVWPTPAHEVYYPPAAPAVPAEVAAAEPALAVPEEAAAPPAPPEEEAIPASPAYTITAPNAEALQQPSTLEPWSGPVWPTPEHEVYYPPAAPAVPEEVAAAQPAPAGPEVAAAPPEGEAIPAEPAYTIMAPNAEALQQPSTLEPWRGPVWSTPEHEVYYPPAAPPAAVGERPVAAGPAPSARVYFRTSRALLPEAAPATLAPIVAYLRQNAEAKAVVQGFHDPRGEQVPNRALARERAESVRAALLAEGIAEDRVLIEQPADPTGSGDYAEARRAEIRIRSD